MIRLKIFFLFAILGIMEPLFGQLPKIRFQSEHTPTYSEMIKTYERLDSLSEYFQLNTLGESDGGHLLHLLVVNKKKQFTPPVEQTEKNAVWLIMNGIHPGESEGIDASILFLETLAKNPKWIPEHVTILVIPAYNVDGMVNRKAFTRANQNGPLEKGFRASACNYDLNRDFLKADSKNTFLFYSVFHAWQPHVFLDTHTSNGADYQYTMTLISTQKQKLGGPAADYMYTEMNPFLYKEMKNKGFEMAPYVNVFGKSPDEEGYSVFIESPKFSSGYAALFGSLSFVAETHMLKPYPQRVKATYALMETFLQFCEKNSGPLVRTKERQKQWTENLKQYSSNYEVSRDTNQNLAFKGYEMEKKASLLGAYERNFYDPKKPYQKNISYFDSCYPTLLIPIPEYFVVPQGWTKTTERLQANGIRYSRLVNDTLLTLHVQYIKQIQYSNRPVEGHFTHSGINCETRLMSIPCFRGDWIIPTNQEGKRYLMEVLSPQTLDGFMAWNFFDPILNEKEGFSDYAFEEDAWKFLEKDTLLQNKFGEWKRNNPEKAVKKYEVLGFIYKNSPYYEKEYMRYPVYSKP